MIKMVLRLFKEVKEYKKASLLTPLLMVGEVLLEIMIPFLMSFIIDEGVNKGNMQAVVMYGLLMLLAAFGSLFCGAMAGKLAAYASNGFAKNVRKSLFHHIQTFSFKNIDKFSTAGLITRLMSDVTNVQNSYQMLLRMCVRSPLTLICAMSMTFIINPSLATVFLYAALFLGIVLVIITKLAFPAFNKMFDRYDDMNASIQENITNIRVVKAYVKEDAETKKFHFASNQIYKLAKKAENIMVANMPIMQLTTYACIIVISWLGAKQIVSDTMTTGELMSMLTYTTNILMSLMMLSMIFVMLTMSLASVKRINEVLDEESDLQNKEDPVMQVKDGSIKFENVAFAYNVSVDSEIFKNFNLEIKSGETIGVLGSTGSGKTSFVSLIPRLYDVNKGNVYVGGVNVKDYDLATLRDNVSMVLQKNVLFSGTIKENLRWGNKDASDEQLIEACKLAQAHDFIMKFPNGYDTYIEQGGSNVSGGQRQRLCIARAILKNPKVLILDDSTSAVDTKTDFYIRKAFREDLKGMTKIIISQRISSLQDADRILVLDDGRIDAFDTHENLVKTNAIYQEVYETQVKGDE